MQFSLSQSLLNLCNNCEWFIKPFSHLLLKTRQCTNEIWFFYKTMAMIGDGATDLEVNFIIHLESTR